MRTQRIALLGLLFVCRLTGEEGVPDSLPVDPPVETVRFELRDRSLFVDQAATATVAFDAAIEDPGYSALNLPFWDLLDYEIIPPEDPESPASLLTIRFVPRQSGLITIPAIEFEAGAKRYRTAPQQIVVGEAVASDAMSLTIEAARTRVHVGEPLRLELNWESTLDARRLAELRLDPGFFSDPGIEVVVPRNTAPEDAQVGLPIGGRRVIATHHRPEGGGESLGSIQLTVFLRFSTPGTVILPATRLECALLSQPGSEFARYAAYYNNSLFETPDPRKAYQRIFTTSEPLTIEVLPLPGDRPEADFSGLFEPVAIDVEVLPTESRIGDLMELRISVTGEAPHGMIELPDITRFGPLRERFLIDPEFSREWQPEGTIFRTRMRILSTSVTAFPSLEIPVFDPGEGRFSTRRTPAIPVTLHPLLGKSFIALKTFASAAVRLSPNEEGIWHNRTGNSMNHLANHLFTIANNHFGILLLLGPLAFLALAPLVLERRRRGPDDLYRRKTEAYRRFKCAPDGSRDQWNALLALLAVASGRNPGTWTSSDTREVLEGAGFDLPSVEAAMRFHEQAASHEYHPQRPAAEFSGLDKTARPIAKALMKGVGLVVLALLFWNPTPAGADEWDEAVRLFEQAQEAPPGSESSRLFYTDAGLRFEAAAKSGSRTGDAWYNAGNAWFQTGETGRAIAAYRRARYFLPFDSLLEENLTAARSLVLNDVPDEQDWWNQLPRLHLKVGLLAANFGLWFALLMVVRYRNRFWSATALLCGSTVLLLALPLAVSSLTRKPSGVIVVDATTARKGPGYAYPPAFNEPLHDGLEFALIEKRDDWAMIRLVDNRLCWIPIHQTEIIETSLQ